jgi:hypothetical protein
VLSLILAHVLGRGLYDSRVRVRCVATKSSSLTTLFTNAATMSVAHMRAVTGTIANRYSFLSTYAALDYEEHDVSAAYIDRRLQQT